MEIVVLFEIRVELMPNTRVHTVHLQMFSYDFQYNQCVFCAKAGKDHIYYTSTNMGSPCLYIHARTHLLTYPQTQRFWCSFGRYNNSKWMDMIQQQRQQHLFGFLIHQGVDMLTKQSTEMSEYR